MKKDMYGKNQVAKMKYCSQRKFFKSSYNLYFYSFCLFYFKICIQTEKGRNKFFSFDLNPFSGVLLSCLLEKEKNPLN